MSVLQSLTAFAVVAGLLTLVPGLDTALVLRTVLRRGRRAAVVTGLGIVSGALVWGAAAAVGASALLAASQLAYRLLTIAGAVYLVVLGIGLLRSSFRRTDPAQPLPTAASGGRAYLTGLTTNLVNPKVGVFYLATIPQFIPAGVVPVVMGVALAGVHALLSMAWFGVLVAGGGAASRILRKPRAAAWIDRVTGLVLIGFGVRLVVEPR